MKRLRLRCDNFRDHRAEVIMGIYRRRILSVVSHDVLKIKTRLSGKMLCLEVKEHDKK